MSPKAEPEVLEQDAEILDPRKVTQLAFFSGLVTAIRRVAFPAPKAIPARLDNGEDLDPADGDILTIAYDVKVFQLVTGTRYKRVKGQAEYVRTKRQELVYQTQPVEGTARIVAHYRP